MRWGGYRLPPPCPPLGAGTVVSEETHIDIQDRIFHLGITTVLGPASLEEKVPPFGNPPSKLDPGYPGLTPRERPSFRIVFPFLVYPLDIAFPAKTIIFLQYAQKKHSWLNRPSRARIVFRIFRRFAQLITSFVRPFSFPSLKKEIRTLKEFMRRIAHVVISNCYPEYW